MHAGSAVFIDTGAWIALALNRDPFHERARESWEEMLAARARLFTSVPVVLETFTFLDRNTVRDVAITWKDSLAKIPRLRILECTVADMRRAFAYFERRDLHKLSAADATSFVLMKRSKLHAAFAFDSHFATAGFRLIG